MSRFGLCLATVSLLGLLNGSALLAQSAQSVQSAPVHPRPPAGAYKLIPIPTPTLSPGEIKLVQLEGDFEKAVEKGGGKAFASWFADDGVTLNNGRPAVRGRRAIAAQATWDPKDYQLTWYAEGAQMGPSGDTGFTWGHYETRSHNAQGKPLATSGRYITFWEKVDGRWKVALDASADDAPTPPTPPQP